MILYIDETENESFFFVTGLLANSRSDIETAYKRFKKSVKNLPIAPRDKQEVFREFKSVILDRKFQRIKFRMLEELNRIDHTVIYSCYVKKEIPFYQQEKESVYLSLLLRIVHAVDGEVDIIFDTFNKTDFEQKIINSVIECVNVRSIRPQDSQREAGLQFVDNLCSVVRLNKSGTDHYSFFSKIENCVIEI